MIADRRALDPTLQRPYHAAVHISRERTIRASADAIWRAIAPVESLPRWLAGVESATLLSGPADGVGRRQRIVQAISGHEVEIEQEVVGWEPARLLRVRYLRQTSGGRELQGVRDFHITLTLAPAGERTRLTAAYSWNASGAQWLRSVLFAGRIFGRELQDTLKKIDALVAP